jgi:plasmid stabilization system protein ParE
MAFEVLITEQAFADLDAITGYIKENSSLERARKWFSAIVGTIETLRELPARRPLAEESEEVGQEVRLLLHGRRNRAYKIYFNVHYDTLQTGTVRVFHIRHWARKGVTADEFRKLMGELDQGGESEDT